MVNRNAYDATIGKMSDIYSHYSGCDFEALMNNITNIKENFDIKLLFVGHFSAGKSSLLNALIGNPDFLKEAQEPQTAIATELIYDENESAFAYNTDGKKEALDPDKTYLPNHYNHLEYRLNAPALKEISDFTIVDTPGIDAGIEAHAQALANYIGMGSAYIVVIDQEKGGIDQTTLDFIEEISNYSQQIAVLINKCDKITPETAESIAESARFTLMMHGLPYNVYTVSRRDEDISDKLISIISTFNAQKAFDDAMTNLLKTELFSAEKILSVTEKKIYLDTYDMDSDIAMYSRAEDQISRVFEAKKQEAFDDVENKVQAVLDEAKNALITKADLVAEALLNGNQTGVEAIIIETVRPIMMAAMKDISCRQVDNIVDFIDFGSLAIESDSVDLIGVVGNLANGVKNIIEQGLFDRKENSNDKPTDTSDSEPEKEKFWKREKSKNEPQNNQSSQNNSNSNKGIYHVVTSIAALTSNVLPPWIEAGIILLPEICKIFRGIFGEKDSDIIKRQFINTVIPQITNKLYPQVKESVKLTTKTVLDEYEKILTEKIENIKKNIDEAQNKKKQKTEDFEKYKATLTEDISAIRNLLGGLE